MNLKSAASKIMKANKLSKKEEKAKKAEKKKPASAKKRRRAGGENAAPASAVTDLVGMGFPAKKARDAVDATGGDVQDCVDWLVANM